MITQESANYSCSNNAAEAMQAFREKGFTVHETVHNLLLLDYDDVTMEGFVDLPTYVQDTLVLLNAELIRTYVSRHGKGHHQIWKVGRPLSFIERISLQMAMGSDPKREALALYHYLKEGAEVSFLAEPPLEK